MARAKKRLPVLLRCLGGPLGAALLRDRVLLVLTVLLSAAVLAPLTQTPLLPLTDLHYHAALAAQARRIFEGDPVASYHFMFQPRPSPYWLTYFLLIGTGSVVGPILATHVVVGLSVLLLPLGVMRLLIALGRSPRLGLWAFAVAWDFSASMGFLAYTLGVGLSLFYLARALEGLRGGRYRSRGQLSLGVGLAVLLSLTHAQASAAVAVLLGLVALAELPRLRRFAWLLGAGALPVLGILPWMLTTPGGGALAEVPLEQAVLWPPAGERFERFLHHSLGFVAGRGASEIQGMTALVLLFLPLVLSIGRPGSRRVMRRALALYAGAWLLLLALPASVFVPFHQILIYERYTTLVLVFGLLLPAAAPVGLRAAWLTPGLLAALLSTGLTTWFFARFGEHTRPLIAVLERIPPGRRVLPVVWSVRTPESVHDTTFGITAYYTALKGGYTPHLFDTPNLPVRYVAAHHVPAPVWKDPRAATIERHGFRYDYVLVQGKEQDRFRAGRRYTTEEGGKATLELLKEAGDFRLYQVRSWPPGPKPAPVSAAGGG